MTEPVAGIASVLRTTMTEAVAGIVRVRRTTMTEAVAGIAPVRRTTMTEPGAASVLQTTMTEAGIGAAPVRQTVAQAAQVRRTMTTELGAQLGAAVPSSILLTCFPRNRSPHFQATMELRKSSPWSTLIYLSYISILRLTV